MNYENIFKLEEKRIKQEELKKYGLDDESIKKFRSKIKKVSYEESQRLGNELCKGIRGLYLDEKRANDYILSGANVDYIDIYSGRSLMQILTHSISILISLIKAGANIDAQYRYGETAAMRYALSGRVDFLKILVLMGADLYIKNNDGKTALDIAIMRKNTECIKILKDAMKLNNVYNNTETDNIEYKKQEYLKQYGLDEESVKEYRSKIDYSEYEYTDEEDFKMLIDAIYNNNIKKVNELIIEGTNVNFITNTKTLYCAIEIKNFDIAILLLKAGYEIDVYDMMQAMDNNMHELCKIILLMGIDLNEKSEAGQTVLDYARVSKKEKYIQLFENIMNGDYSIIFGGKVKKEYNPNTLLEALKEAKREMSDILDDIPYQKIKK